MGRSRFVFSVCFAALLSAADNGVAQNAPGYRMRMPIHGSTLGRIGAPVRPPRLSSFADGVQDHQAPFRRQFIPRFQDFGWYLVGSDGYYYPDDSTTGYSTEAEPAAGYSTEPGPARDVYPVYDSMPEVGPLEVSSRRVGADTLVRLSWRDRGIRAAQVAFFLADSARAVLSAQTDRSPPFEAQLEPPAATAFAGMTVVLPGGNLVTRYVRYGRSAR